MTVALIILGAVAWYGVGVGGFVYWWTHSHDLDQNDALFALFAGVAGPLTWIIGWSIHGDRDKVVIRKRGAA